MLELVASSAIAVAVIVPAMVAMRQSLQMSRGVSKTNTITTFCVGKMEQELVAAATDFQKKTFSGDFKNEGQPDLKFSIERTDASARGGQPGRLMAVHVVVWADADGDGKIGAKERRIWMSSKVAKLATYQSQAKNKGKGKGKGK